MEIIRLPGYTEYEKYHIAREFLVSKQIEINGLEEENVTFPKNAVLTIIQRYTREAGVRNLEREIASICRKIAREVVTKKGRETVLRLPSKSVQKYLGPPRFRARPDGRKRSDRNGYRACLDTGGRRTAMCRNTDHARQRKADYYRKTGRCHERIGPGGRQLCPFTCRAPEDRRKFYKKYDIHIHIPEGAIPKDGPSAGISMCTSMVSALTKSRFTGILP